MKNDLIKIVNYIPILDVAVRLGIQVKNNKAICFIHNDCHPSLSFNCNKNYWHCFGCNKSGSNIGLVENYNRCNTKEAILWLANEFGIISTGLKIISSKRTSKILSRPLKSIIEFKADSEVYESFLAKCSLTKEGEEYLRGRGFSKNTLRHFLIKDIVEIKKVERQLLNEFEQKRLISSGLFALRKQGLSLIWWDHTILFPFYEDNRVIYIQGRRVCSYEPKYLGLCGIKKPLFNGDILEKLTKRDTVYICEGVPDTLSAYQLGMHSIGVLGATSFEKGMVDRFLEFNVIVVPDNDSAGNKFAENIKDIFNNRGHAVQLLRLTHVKDLNELLLRGR
jgi:DNA primase catalytic core